MKKKVEWFFRSTFNPNPKKPFLFTLERDAGLDARSSERSVTTTLWGLKVRSGVRRPCVDLDLDLDLASDCVCVCVCETHHGDDEFRGSGGDEETGDG